MSSENKICHIQIYVSSVAGINFCEMELLLIARKGTKSIQSNHCRIDSHILTIINLDLVRIIFLSGVLLLLHFPEGTFL